MRGRVWPLYWGWCLLCLPGLPGAQHLLPSQPLAQALARFDEYSGFAGFYRADLVRGRASAEVVLNGQPVVELAALLNGSGLWAEFTGDTRYVLGPLTVDSPRQATALRPAGQAGFQARLQQAVVKALCREAATAPGDYRLALALHIGAGGMTDAVHLLGSSGQPARDRLIQAALEQLRPGEAPAGTSAPFVVLITPSTVSPCAPSDPASGSLK